MSHPLVYEINTRCWLRELAAQLGHPVTLDNVPDDALRLWQDLGFSHVWLLGVWTTGPASQESARQSTGLRQELDHILPQWQPDDVDSSPFAVANYKVPRALGGEKGLQEFRQRLHDRGLKLILDFVPNHVGLDHPWLTQKPELFVRSPEPLPGTFQHPTPQGPAWIAHGKDPNFPPWVDTAQLDFRRIDTQRAVAEALQSVARRCDGVRCDMAMLALHDVFERNWSQFPGPEIPAEGEFWANVIRKIRRSQPDLLLLAEVYWDLEAHLQSLGFDYTYDKRLYDYLVVRDGERTRQHLVGVGPRFLNASAHFLENHDEVRIATALGLAEHRAAALLTLGLPGLRLLHQGQLEGARVRVPVQLTRRPNEPVDQAVNDVYNQLLRTLQSTAVGRGRAQVLANRPAWPGNTSDRTMIVIQWQIADDAFDLVVVNLAPHASQCYVQLAVPRLADFNWHLKDLLGTEEYHRTGDDLLSQGLYLDVPACAAQLFHFAPQA